MSSEFVKLYQHDGIRMSPVPCDPTLPGEDLHFQCIKTAETNEACEPPTWPEEEDEDEDEEDED